MISRSLALLAAIGLLAAGVQPVAAQGGRGYFGGSRGGGMFHGGGFGRPPGGGGGRGGFAPPAGEWRGGANPYRNGGGYPGGGYPGAYPGNGPGGARWGPEGPPPAYRGPAPNSLDQGWREQQDEVRRAVREGRHISLNQAIEAVRRRAPGRELDAGLEPGPDGRQVYRLRWAGQNGRRTDYMVDAATGRIIGVVGGP
jgi:hypothetical protein